MDSQTLDALRLRSSKFLMGRTPPHKINITKNGKKMAGVITVGEIPQSVDIIWGLDIYPYPFADNSVEKIYCTDFIEHVEDIIKFISELYRICKHGAEIYIESPYYTSIFAWSDPTHKRAINEMTYLFFDKLWRQASEITSAQSKTDFRIKKVTFGWDKRMVDASEEEKEFARNHYWNVIVSIGVVMECFKEEAK
jgi:SAM-dependent methyltransferase